MWWKPLSELQQEYLDKQKETNEALNLVLQETQTMYDDREVENEALKRTINEALNLLKRGELEKAIDVLHGRESQMHESFEVLIEKAKQRQRKKVLLEVKVNLRKKHKELQESSWHHVGWTLDDVLGVVESLQKQDG